MELKEAIATIAKAAKEIEDKPPGEVQIVVLDRGFVYVGDVTIGDQWVTIRNACNVRRWGTSKGLGELAKSGPTANSVIDPAGLVRAPLRALIGMIECEASSWK